MAATEKDRLAAHAEQAEPVTWREYEMWRLMHKAAAIISAVPGPVFAGWSSNPYEVVKEIEALNIQAPAPSAASGLEPTDQERMVNEAIRLLRSGGLPKFDDMKELCDAAMSGLAFERLLRSHQAPVGEDKDGERYRWFNKNYDFLAYVRGEDGQKTYRLRCGEPLNAWIDREIEKERARQAAAPSPQTGGGS